MRRTTTTLAAGASVALLGACSSGPSGSDGEDAAPEDLTEVSVGAIPIGDVAPLHLGVAEGFFEEEGLGVTVENTSGGAVAVPGVVSGNLDFAFGNTVSLMVARGEGLDLRYVTSGAATTGEEGADFAGVVVPEDSPIQDVADLEGKTISSNNLANIGDTSIRMAMDSAGADGSTPEFVEVAFPEAMAAAENGQVDAALILEPFLTSALQSGGRVVLWNYAQAHPELDIGGYFASGETFEQDPELIEKFERAMTRSLEYSQQNPEEVREIIGTYTQIDEELLQDIVLPRFPTEFDREAATALGEAAVKYGTLDEAPDLDALLPTGGE